MQKNKFISIVKLFILYVSMGVVSGGIGALFSWCISLVTNVRHENPWVLYLLPLAGLASVALYKWLKVSDMSTNQVFQAIDGKKALSPKLAPAIFFASLLSHLGGASVGREGAALQLGGSSALLLSQLFKLSKEEEKVLLYCGMAGFFSSVFGTPFAAAAFALEVVFVGHVHRKAILPVCITSAVSSMIARLLGAHAERFHLSVVPTPEFSVLWKILLISLFAVMTGIVFCRSLEYSKGLFKKAFKNEFLRIAVGGVAIVLLTLAAGSYDYNGAGVNIIEKIFDQNEFVPWAFVLKILFTCLAIGSGFKGGEIVPSLFIGAAVGATIGVFFDLPAPFAAALSMIALFCSVTNCPFASLLLAAELFTGKGIGYMCIAVAISYFLSGRISLYSAQKAEGFKAKF